MAIDMQSYVAIHNKKTYDALSILVVHERNNLTINADGETIMCIEEAKINFIEATVLNEFGEIEIIQDLAPYFKFAKR